VAGGAVGATFKPSGEWEEGGPAACGKKEMEGGPTVWCVAQ
jgi:hypothetical protein